jgi:hypothetical protein
MTDVPDLPRLVQDYKYPRILEAVRKQLALKGEHGDGSIFGFAYCKYYTKNFRELTGKEWSDFDAQAARCAAGEEALPIFFFSYALIELYGARVH